MNGSARVLHISDLHHGLAGQQTLMPAYRRALYDDLRRMTDQVGAIDLVVFSGDLVQKGAPAEYDSLEVFLSELWAVLAHAGMSPSLFCVPGNHDLARPPSGSTAAKAMQHWWDDEDMGPHLFDKDGDYLSVLQNSFKNYTAWLSRTNIPLLDVATGYLPGDSIGTFVSKDGFRLGLIGLNSSWLQLREGDLRGKLHVAPEQLVSLVKDPDVWGEHHDATLLVTHHPVDWLHPSSQSAWKSEINTNQRFDFHLCGHMHDQQLTSVQSGGATVKRSIQSASLFGLERAAGGGVERRHGYSLLAFGVGESQNQMRFFPRKGIVIKGDGQHRLVADVDLGLENDNGLNVTFRARRVHDAQASEASLDKQLIEGVRPDVLLGLRRPLSLAGAWSGMRGWERETAKASLAKKKYLWVVADWGMGFEEFLYTLSDQSSTSACYHQIALNVGATKEQMLASVEERFGVSLEAICLALSSNDSSYLVVEDVSIDGVASDSMLEVLSAVSDYCPQIHIVIKSRFRTKLAVFAEVVLKPLDEVDAATYIRTWSGGKYASLGEAAVATIIRHSGGIPARLESAVEDFSVFGASELGGLNPDLDLSLEMMPGRISPIISRDIERLSSGPESKKLVSLLHVLAMFPRGETFDLIKRFNGPNGFHPQEARELIRLALLDSTEVVALSGHSESVLIVPVPVREALYGILSDDEFARLSLKALELYFGRDWKVRGMKAAKVKFQDSACESWKIANASAMVHRVVRAAVRSGASRAVDSALQLAYMYAKSLENGDHFRSCADFCGDVMPLLRGVSDARRCDELSYVFCKSLRMSGRHEDSLAEAERIGADSLTNVGKQGLHYCRAESLRALKQKDEAIRAAKCAISMNPKSANSLQANALLVDLGGGEGVEGRLEVLERRARKNKYSITAGNIAISRSYSMDLESAISTLRRVQQEAKLAGNAHNCVRATARLARLLVDDGRDVDQVTYKILLDGYHMVHADGSNRLFDQITSVLWDIFNLRGELMNQISLFRHSSLRWRLRDDLVVESEYIEVLPAIVERLRIQGMHERFEVVYVMSRM